MTKFYVMYWNDRKDYPVAVFEVEADNELEAEQIAYENGGKKYEDRWPLLTETDLTENQVERYKNSVYTDYYVIENNNKGGK